MIKKTIDYVDFNDADQTEEAYFNLTEAEITRIEVQFDGGMAAFIETFDAEERPEDILRLFEIIIQGAYGKKSKDGQRFVKTDESTKAFIDSAAYSALFVHLIRNGDEAEAFFNGVLSKTVRD